MTSQTIHLFRHFREKHGLTQLQLALKIGLTSQAAVWHYENNERDPIMRVAKKFIRFAKKEYGEDYALGDIYTDE